MPSQMGNPPSGPGPMPRGQVQAQYKSASAMTSNAICKRNVRVWVCGNSYICSVTEHVANNPDQSNLWFPMSDLVVQWIGKADLQWDGLFQLLLEKRQHCVPDIIVLHIGENNVVNPLAELQFKIKEILNTVRAWWPRCHLVWSDILPRLHWKEAESQRAAQEVRRLHNVYMHEQMQSFGGTVIAHDIITPENKELYMPDGVHLSKAGLEIFIRDLQFGVVTAMHDILSKSQEMDEAQKLPLTDPRASMQRGPAVSGVPPPRGLLGDGPNDPRGGTLHAVTSDVDPPNRFLGAPHPGPPLHHIPPHDNRGPPAHELRGGPMESRGMIEPRGPLLDQRGPPLDTRAGRDPRSMDARNMESRVPVPAPRVTMPGGGGGGIPNQGPIPMSSSGPQVPRPAPSLQVNSQGGGFSPAQNQVTPQDHEKAALIMQVLQLTPDQIAMLPPEQRQSILILKEQIQKSTGAS
ncbi:cleavage stimulation factor subunit 2 isoform X1 [Protopterus annectens]|uniref:cleavage stimulation factor subunit 2 isoform X1 n=1 Tax=Protopterus annectens TaxID=7888 RepID=UPI001CFBB9E9|nr:cleavage stimulation factor subunit 2 isoform X1 [Protopterus annectens]XP_043913545.1 cleavage stimulation factor subunit 2 isoform X1 [Protopterus annectens]